MIEVELTPAASEAIERLPKVIRARAYALVERLRNWPNVSGVKPLRKRLAGQYRILTCSPKTGPEGVLV